MCLSVLSQRDDERQGGLTSIEKSPPNRTPSAGVSKNHGRLSAVLSYSEPGTVITTQIRRETPPVSSNRPRITSMIRIPQLSLRLSEILRRTPVMITDVRNTKSSSPSEEKYLRRLLWYLLGGTRGGPNRAEIIKTLQNRPCNANQLAETLRVDYKTIQHHVRILEENGLVSLSNKGNYGAVLFLTTKMEDALPILDEIWSRIGTRKISAPVKE